MHMWCLIMLTAVVWSAQTFGWFVQYGRQPLREHFMVFWVGPLLGGLLAGLTWNALVEAKPGQKPSNKIPVDPGSAHTARSIKKGQ